ncbi:MAG: TatD family hydrolase [Anaerolineales bacterium]|nr:TatD family hydrolase [Anaerolineales bacterium]
MSNVEGQFVLIDSHFHLDISQFTEDRDAVVVRAGAAGVHRIVIPAIEVGTLPHLLAVAERYAGLYAAVGASKQRDQFSAATVNTLRTYAARQGGGDWGDRSRLLLAQGRA